MATPQQIASLKKQADAIQTSLNKSIASGEIKKGNTNVITTPTKTPTTSGSLKDLSIGLAQQTPKTGGSIQDLSIGLAKGNKITQADIQRAQSGGASLASLTAPSSPVSTGGTTPVGTVSSNQTGVSNGGRYSRYSNKDEQPVVEEPNLEQIQRNLTRNAQKEINSLHKYEKSLLSEQLGINQQAERSNAAVSTLTGLAGSTEANVAQQATTAKGQQANQQIRSAVENQVQGVLAKVRSDAQQQYQFERTQANVDAKTRQEFEQTAKKNAQENLMVLAQTGATADGLKQTDPQGYQHLAQQVGGEEMLKAMFTLNRPIDTIIDKKLEGGKYMITWQNPLDGKIRIETMDTGLPTGYSKTIDAGNRILAVPDNWDGDPSKLVTINKGLTPSQSAAGATGGGGAYASDLDAIIGSTLSSIPSKFGQSTFQSQINRARNDADKINLIATQVLKGQPAELKLDFANQAVGISQLDKAINALDAGVKTGALQAGAQYAANFFGRDYDPKLAQINGYITSAIQPYRNSVTGAAWGEQEDGEYASLFGSTKYSPTELRQRLVQMKDTLKSKSAQGLNTFVNPMGYYGNQFESGAYAPQGEVQAGPDGQQYVFTD